MKSERVEGKPQKEGEPVAKKRMKAEQKESGRAG